MIEQKTKIKKADEDNRLIKDVASFDGRLTYGLVTHTSAENIRALKKYIEITGIHPIFQKVSLEKLFLVPLDEYNRFLDYLKEGTQ